MNCAHDHDGDEPSVVDSDGITACCAAYTSIAIDDGTEYCKCCYAEISGGAITERTTITVGGRP